jgi:hypothetical protein
MRPSVDDNVVAFHSDSCSAGGHHKFRGDVTRYHVDLVTTGQGNLEDRALAIDSYR